MHDILVGTYQSTKPLAVHYPGKVRDVEIGAQTYDWRARAGSLLNSAGIRPAGVVMSLRRACETRWTGWGMLTAYVLLDARGAPLPAQPRVAKDAVPWLREQGFAFRFGVLMADWDTPGHVAWTPELYELAQAARLASPTLATAGLYYSASGARIVQPLAEPIDDPDRFEDIAHAWSLQLCREGIDVDMRCRDWTRMQAAPRVRGKTGARLGETFAWDAAFGDARALALAELPAHRRYEARGRGVAATRGADGTPGPLIDFAAACPPMWRPRALTIAEAIRGVPTEWHTLFLALAGALCERNVPPELVPAIVGAVSAATGLDTKGGDRVAGAQTTVARWLAPRETGTSAAVRGYDALLVDWPDVAVAVDEAVGGDAPSRLRAACREHARAPELPHASEQRAAMERCIAEAPLGVTLVVGPPGLGKTQAYENVATARAGTTFADPDATSDRAPAHSKTTISVQTNQLGRQVTDDIRARTTPARRIFSPLSVLRSDGAPECRFHAAGLALASGGQSVRREFCEGRGVNPCPHRAVCTAADGADGPETARVVVGNHALLGELVTAAGPTGKLIIDEPPELLAAVRFSPLDFAVVETERFAFGKRYTEALRPVLYALADMCRDTADLTTARPFREAIRDYAARNMNPGVLYDACEAAGIAPRGEADVAEVDAADDPGGVALECAERAHPRDRRGDPPPLTTLAVMRMRDGSNPAVAQAIGGASRLLHAVYRAATEDADHVVRVERNAAGAPTLVLTAPSARYVTALRRDGSTVILDATPDVAVLSRAAGVDLEATGRVHRFEARDGAPIDRTLIYDSHATRKALYTPAGLDPARLAAVVRATVRWALEDPDARTLAFISFRRVVQAVVYALVPRDPRTEDAWRFVGLPAQGLQDAADVVRPILDEWTAGGARRLLWGHYGALRGLDYMKDADALATVGDPWPSLLDAREGSAYLELPDWEDRYREMAMAEAAQAQGRFRTLWRDRPGRALVVGAVLPSGSSWSYGVHFRRLTAHRVMAESVMLPEQLRAIMTELGLSVRAMSRRSGIAHQNLTLMLRGERAITAKWAERLSLCKIAVPTGTGSRYYYPLNSDFRCQTLPPQTRSDCPDYTDLPDYTEEDWWRCRPDPWADDRESE